MLSSNEHLWYTDMPSGGAVVFESLLEFLVIVLVHVDVFDDHANAQVVKQIQNVTTLFESRAYSTTTGDVDHNLSSLCI